MLLRTIGALTIVAVFLLPMTSFAFDVQPGTDVIRHIPPTGWDFGPVPIDSDFFGPGSDPFDGGIPADETSLDPTPDCPGATGDISMLIRRLDTAILPSIPSSDVIDTEIIAMSLVSSSPIVVTYNGGLNPELWSVEITPSPLIVSSGTMTIRFEDPQGGTFDAEFLLQPFFTFTRVSDGEVRTLDGSGKYQDPISASGVPWVYEAPGVSCPPCASNFIPGHDGTGKVEYTYSGTLSQHTAVSSCIDSAIPSLSGWSRMAAIIVLLALGSYLMMRRRTFGTR